MARLGRQRAMKIGEPFYVYLVGWDIAGPIKVGLSYQVDKRLIQLQTGCPYKLSVLHRFEYEDYTDAEAVESALLGRFKKRALCGEWLDISCGELVGWAEKAGIDSL